MHDGLLEARPAHILPRVDIDRHQGFGLVDDDVPAGLEPDPRTQRAINLDPDAARLEEGPWALMQPDGGDERRVRALQECPNLARQIRCIDDDLLHARRKQVPKGADRRPGLGMQQRRGRDGLGQLPDRVPLIDEGLRVRLQQIAPEARAGGADDEAARSLQPVRDGLDQVTQPCALLRILDPPRHADVSHTGEEHQKAARKGHMGGDARPFLGDRLLGHLNDDGLPLAHPLLDAPRDDRGRLRDRSAVAGRGERGPEGVLDVQEPIALQSEIDERRLHSGEDVPHPPEIDVAGDPPGRGALDLELDEMLVLDQRDPHLPRDAVDAERFLHPQFTRRRIQTFSTNPMPISVLSRQDPP